MFYAALGNLLITRWKLLSASTVGPTPIRPYVMSPVRIEFVLIVPLTLDGMQTHMLYVI